MRPIVFEFDDYKIYLNRYIQGLPRHGYGFKSRMAAVLECKSSFVTQVLNGNANLSLEQAESLNGLLKHQETEGEYFLTMVLLSRAGSEALRHRLQKRLKKLRENQMNLKERFSEQTEIDPLTLHEFFSVWHFNAIQIAATIPRLQSRKTLRQSLGLSHKAFDEALQFLMTNNLLKEENSRLLPTKKKIFIGKDSLALKVHHSNWRQRAILSLDRNYEDDLHFTSVFSLSRKEVALIKDRLVREIEQIRQMVKTSPEEEVHTCLIDFFRVDEEG